MSESLLFSLALNCSDAVFNVEGSFEATTIVLATESYTSRKSILLPVSTPNLLSSLLKKLRSRLVIWKERAEPGVVLYV